MQIYPVLVIGNGELLAACNCSMVQINKVQIRPRMDGARTDNRDARPPVSYSYSVHELVPPAAIHITTVDGPGVDPYHDG